MNGLAHFSITFHRTGLWRQALVLACFALAALSAFAQGGSMSPYQGEQDGVSAGGKWMKFQSEDKMTGAKKVRFELLADNYFHEDPNYKPRVDSVCEDGKLKLADFNPGVRLPPPESSRLLGTASARSRSPHRRLSHSPWLELGARTLPLDGQRHRARPARRTGFQCGTADAQRTRDRRIRARRPEHQTRSAAPAT